MPEPEIAEEETEQLPGLQKQNAEEQQEWHLVRVLIEYGYMPYEGYANVAALVHERIDPELIDNRTARQLFDLYFDYLNTTGSTPEVSYFVTYPDSGIQHRVATLLQNRHDISPKWMENYGIEVIHGEQNYIPEAESTLTYFELKKLKLVLAELWERIGQEKDIQRLMLMQQKLLQLKKEEADIVKKMGTVVIK